MSEFPEAISPEQQAEMEKERTLSDAHLLKEGANYVVVEGEKRLELTEKQVEAAQHEMDKTLVRQAKLAEFLKSWGIESLEGVSSYKVPYELKYEGKGAACCAVTCGPHDWNDNSPDNLFDRPSERLKNVVAAMRSQHPDLSHESVFVLVGCGGSKVLVKGDQIAWNVGLLKDAF